MLPRFSARLRVRLTTTIAAGPSARGATAWPASASASWSGRKLCSQRSRGAGIELEERRGDGAQHDDGAALRQGERPRLDRERQAIDLGHRRGRAAAPYSFSMVHCSGCWLRRA